MEKALPTVRVAVAAVIAAVVGAAAVKCDMPIANCSRNKSLMRSVAVTSALCCMGWQQSAVPL